MNHQFKLFRSFVSFLIVVTLLTQSLAPVIASRGPQPEATISISNSQNQNLIQSDLFQPPLPEPAGASPDHSPVRTVESTSLYFDPSQRVNLLAQTQGLDYTSYTYSHSDIILFAYEDATQLEVYNSSGTLIWTGTLNTGQHHSLTPGAGVYFVAASSPFSINVGDALTGYVWGYYAMDQSGKGLSTLFYTYQANWSDTLYDPNFIIFAYENNTTVALYNTTTGQAIWSGNLDAGEHYANTTIKGTFLSVSSDKPVSALSYTDQGYYVPSDNGTFVGHAFYTYVGNSSNWTEDLNLIAYENSTVSVHNTTTGSLLWSGNIGAGEVHSISDLNGQFVTIESSGRIATSVSPFISFQSSYYHSIYAQDASGTGIGNYFVVPTISSGSLTCRLVLFSYNDGAFITIKNRLDSTVWSGTLNQAESKILSPENTVYTINSSGDISTLLDCGDNAGAEFAPVHYATVHVNVTSPLGGSFYYGDSVLVQADVSLQGEPLLGATVVGQMNLTSGGNYLTFDMNDNGLNGDTTANDGTYAANITLPGPADLPTGNYYLLISAQKTGTGGVNSGNGAAIFSLVGLADGSLVATPTLDCPSSPEITLGQTCTLFVDVAYPDSSIHSDGTVKLTVLQPDQQETQVNLSYLGSNHWQGSYTFAQGGRHLLDIQARPPATTAYLPGYASLVGDVLGSDLPLTITPQGLPTTFLRREVATLSAQVQLNGQPISGANLTAEVNPGGAEINFTSIGNGQYVGLYRANDSGNFNINFTATSPLYKSGTAISNFTVSTSEENILAAVQATANSNALHLGFVGDDMWHVAQDGDYFWQKIPDDYFTRDFNFIVNIIGLGLSLNEAVSAWKQAATQSTAPVSSRFAGTNLFSWLRDQADNSIDGRVFRSWATRVETSVQSGLFDQYLLTGEFPRGIGTGVLRRAGVYYTSEFVGETMDEVAQDWIQGNLNEYLGQQRLDNQNFLKEEMYPILSGRIDEDTALVNDYAQAILAAPPTISNDLEAQLIEDLQSRRLANYYFMRDVTQRNTNLWTAQDAREASDNAAWYEEWGLRLWKIGTPIVIGVACGGPVGATVGVVIAAESLVEDWVRDSYQLNLDERMHALAYGSMLSAMDQEENIASNALSGLAQVRQGQTANPEVPQGEIVSIEDISRGENHIILFSERQAVSRVTIRNTGDYPAGYSIRTYYDRFSNWGTQFDVFWTDSIYDPETGQTVGWVDLAPGQSKTVEVVFKDKDQNDLDMRPGDGDDITFMLSAVTLDGFYFAGAAGSYFNPQRELTTGMIREGVEDLPLISHPIATQLGKDKYGEEYVIRLNVSNPFPYPVSTELSQPVPTGLKILAANGGLVADSQIQWRRIIEPHGSYEFTYLVRNTLSTDLTVPAAQVSFYIASENSYAHFSSVPVTIAPSDLPTIYLPLISRPYLGWTTIMSEGFEGAFPTGQWAVFDNNGSSYGELYWDEDDYKPYQGNYSAWAANGGSNGTDPQYYNYPNYMNSWMVYGPFDLSNAADAQLLFSYWNESESSFDRLFWGASSNGYDFYGMSTSGSSLGWQSAALDLTNVPTLGNLTGDSTVWIAFVFLSDSSITYKGPFIDNIVLQKSAVPMLQQNSATVPEGVIHSDNVSLTRSP